MTISRRTAILALAGSAAMASASAQTAAWPARPIKVIVPAPPGGAYDTTTRAIMQEMSVLLNQPIVIENKASAGNITGAYAGSVAPADGYTLAVTGMINTIVDGVYPNVSFNIVSDFAHIGEFGAAAQWLLVRADAGISSAEDLIKQAKKDPKKINYASSGVGSAGHLIMELMQRHAGIELTHVPYKGGAPALQDVLSGVVSVIMLTPNIATPHIKSGRLKLLAVSSEGRIAEFKEAPTFKELGYPELTISSWLGLSAPKGTPPAVVQRISQALTASLENPKVRAKLELDGITPRITTPAQYAELVRTDTDKWGQLTRSLKLKVE